jgi:site-specific DNA recombinase
VLGYGRVSQVNGRGGPSFIAPDSYRETIARFVSQRGHELVETVIELDESGGTLNRPEFQRILARLAEGEADGLCVPNLARFSRSTIEGLTLARDLKEAGKALLIADLDMDTTTPTGKMMLTVLLAVGEMELDMSRERWAVAQRKAMGRGVYPGTTPLGYVRAPDGRMLVDPVAGPVIRQLFEQRAAGVSWAKLGRFLDARLPRSDGAPWRPSTVSGLVDSPLYLGRLQRHVNGRLVVVEKAHEPLVTRAVFEAAQSTPATYGPRRHEHPAALAGLARCGSCGSALTRGGEGKRRNGKVYRYSYYVCTLRCGRMVKVSTGELDRHVLGVALERLRNTKQIGASRRNDSDVKALNAELAEAEAERDAFVRVASALTDEAAFAQGLRVRQQAVDDVLARLAEAARRERSGGRSVDDVIEILERGNDGQRNTELRRLIAAVTVEKANGPGRQSDLAERVTVLFRDEEAAQRAGEIGGKPVRQRTPVAA